MADDRRELKRVYPAVLAIIVGLAGFLFFGVFFRDRTPAIATEIAAAFFGALITVLITMLLLDRQSRAQKELLDNQAATQRELLNQQVVADEGREMKAAFLAQKIATFNELMDEIRNIVVRGKVEPKDCVALQIVNQKLALYASSEVLKAFRHFTQEFGQIAEDGEIDDAERARLLELLADLSGKMRRDLGTGGDLTLVAEQEIVDSVKVNAKALSVKSTTKEEFLGNCDGEEIEYYRKLWDFLEKEKVAVVMGQKGFSIRNKAGRPRLRCYPTNVSRSIEIANKGLLRPAAAAKVRELLPPEVASGLKDDKTYIRVRPADLPIDDLLRLVDLLVS